MFSTANHWGNRTVKRNHVTHNPTPFYCKHKFIIKDEIHNFPSFCAHKPGSHTELLKDPEGAYTQLIKLQEIRKESEQIEDTSEISRHSSLRKSSLRSLSHGSSGRISSSRHSFTLAEPKGNPTDELPSQEKPEVSIWRLAALNKPEIPSLLLGSLSACANGLIFPIVSIIFSSAIKMFYQPPHILKKDSKFWALMFLIIGIASFVTQPLQFFFFAVAGCKLIQRIRSMCFEKAIYMEVGWFDEPDHSSGAIGARLSADASIVRALVGDTLGLTAQNIATAVAGLVIAFTANWILALIILGLIPFIGLNGYVQVKFLTGFSADAKVISLFLSSSPFNIYELYTRCLKHFWGPNS